MRTAGIKDVKRNESMKDLALLWKYPEAEELNEDISEAEPSVKRGETSSLKR